jgi:hypothetical protein
MWKKLLSDLLVKLASFVLQELAGVIITKPWQNDNPDVSVDPEPMPVDTVGKLSTLSLSEKQSIFALNVCKLIEYGASLPGYSIAFGEAWRSPETQEIYFKTGRSKIKFSKHQDRLAVDLVVRINGVYQTGSEAYKPLADYWKTLHPSNRAGYDFKTFPDANHFEMT